MTFFKTTDKPWQAAYAITLIIPWALIFNRVLADIGCITVGALWLWQSYRHRDWHWLSDPVVKWGLMAWAWMLLVASPFGADTMYSFGEAAAWIRFVLLYAALTRWVLRDAAPLCWLVIIMAVMFVGVDFDTWWQYIHGVSLTGHATDATGRLRGPMSNVKVGIFVAKLLLPAMGVCFFFALKHRWYVRGALSVVLLLISIGIVMLSGERTAFLSMFLGTACAIGCCAWCEPVFRKASLALFLAIIAGGAWMLITQRWVDIRAIQFGQVIAHFGSSEYGQLFKGGYLVGRDHWLTGAGFRGFRVLCPDLLAQQQVTVCNLHPHNPYIEWFSETGLVGLLLFIALILLLARRALNVLMRHTGAERILPAFALGTLVMHFFPFMPTQSFFSNWPALLLWYSLSLAFASFNLMEPVREESNRHC